jgi:hypothetical protein
VTEEFRDGTELDAFASPGTSALAGFNPSRKTLMTCGSSSSPLARRNAPHGINRDLPLASG